VFRSADGHFADADVAIEELIAGELVDGAVVLVIGMASLHPHDWGV
jgi:hypothetical protein